MHSSTSSFDPAPPGGPWGKTWLVAVVALLGALLAVELLARHAGFETSVTDDLQLWASSRQRCSQGARPPIVLLGSSRMLAALSPRVWEVRFAPARVIQLGLEGSDCIPVLLDLANDRQFSGLIVCDLFDNAMAPASPDVRSQRAVDYFHREWRFSKAIECRIWTALQCRWVSFGAGFSLPRALKVVTGAEGPPYFRVLADRSCLADYSRTDPLRIEHRWVEMAKAQKSARDKHPPYPALDKARLRTVNQAIQLLEQRGGRVVFVRFPTTGRLRELENELFPRSAFWDVMAASLNASFLHYEDSSLLSSFGCPDGSHIDQKDVPAFSLALAAELEARGMLKMP